MPAVSIQAAGYGCLVDRHDLRMIVRGRCSLACNPRIGSIGLYRVSFP
jgi:hypothetical protein